MTKHIRSGRQRLNELLEQIRFHIEMKDTAANDNDDADDATTEGMPDAPVSRLYYGDERRPKTDQPATEE